MAPIAEETLIRAGRLKTLCVMGKFRNGELTTGFIELSVNFRDFALHYEWPPTDALSLPLIKGSFAPRRWSTSSSFSSATVAHADFNRCNIPAFNPRRRQCVESSTVRSRALRGSWRSTVVMESKTGIDWDRITRNAMSLASESVVNSPLRNAAGEQHRHPRSRSLASCQEQGSLSRPQQQVLPIARSSVSIWHVLAELLEPPSTRPVRTVV